MVVYNGQFEAYYLYDRFVIILAKSKRVIELRVATDDAFNNEYLQSYDDTWKNHPLLTLSDVQFFHGEEDGTTRSSSRSRLDATGRLTATSNEQKEKSVARKHNGQEFARPITIITIKRKSRGEESRME